MSAMHPALARAQLLMGHSRFRLAEEELRRALRDEPENAVLHAWLALCLAEDRDRLGQALAAAQRATAHDPEQAFGWYALSVVHTRCGFPEVAEEPARVALRLAPDLPPLLVHMAHLRLGQHRYLTGLEFAERALALAPDNLDALSAAGSLRSRLGHHRQAQADFDRALELAPDDNEIQGNAGWAALRRGDARAALPHMRESLRLDPRDPGAQRGLLEALRSRNPVYLVWLRAALKGSRFPRFLLWAACFWAVGGLAYVSLGDADPSRMLPLQVIVVATVILSWTARPLADLPLLGNREARNLLDSAEKAAAVGVSALLAIAGFLAAAWQAGAPRGTGLAAMLAILLSIPVAAAPRAAPGRPRVLLAGMAALLAAAGVLAVLAYARRQDAAGIWVSLVVAGAPLADLVAPHLPRGRG